MKRVTQLLSAALLGAAALAAAGQASATTATGNLAVSMTIVSSCVVSNTSLAFGNQNVLTAQQTQNGTVGVQCTNNTTYQLGLNAGTGTGASVTVRKMTSGAGATVNYGLYQNAGLTTNWGNTAGTDTVGGTGNGALQSVTVYGAIPAQTTPAAGAYTDTVTVTATY